MLGVSLLLEGFSLLVAIRTVTAGAASHGISFAEFVKRGMDPTSIAVMMEDGAACAGLVIAGQAYLPRWSNIRLSATLAEDSTAYKASTHLLSWHWHGQGGIAYMPNCMLLQFLAF